MSAISKSADWILPEEYLEGERSADVGHEYERTSVARAAPPGA
jgi:hypothetical protein